MKVSVSILKTQKEKDILLNELNETSCDAIHIDFTDGVFAGEKNYDLNTILSLLTLSKKPLDIHLMVKEPMKEIQELIKLNPQRITIHFEIPNYQEYLKKIKENGILAGLAINPETKVEEIQEALPIVDTILVLGVHPGFGGQAFIPETYEKLKKLKEMQSHFSYEILLDGGVNEKVAAMVYPYVDILVSGAFVCNEENMEKQIETLKNPLK